MGILEGLPAGVPVRVERVNAELLRRQGGHGRGGRMKIERDTAEFLAGLRHGFTLGSPVGILIQNRDWDNWKEIMAPEGAPAGWDAPDEGGEGPEVPAFGAALARNIRARPVTRPRPGHGDLAGGLKYDHHDLRNVLERASARETAMRVAIGAVCQEFLEALGMRVLAHVTALGGVTARVPEGMSPAEVAERAEASPVRCADPEAGAAMVAAIDAARQAGDTVGGVVEVMATGLPAGLGSHVASDRRLDGRLAAALMSIQAIKGVEVGLGFGAAFRPGSQVHDEILAGDSGGGWFRRGSNRAGGLEAGMTNGQTLVARAAMKPIATLYKPLRSVDVITKEETAAGVERSDTCAVPAAAVVGQGAVAFVLAQAVLEKFGGDSLGEVRRNWTGYQQALKDF